MKNIGTVQPPYRLIIAFVFLYLDTSPNFKTSDTIYNFVDWFVAKLVGNPETVFVSTVKPVLSGHLKIA